MPNPNATVGLVDAGAPVRAVPRVRDRADARALLMPLIASGVLMAAYLALRPYGDSGSAPDREVAEAFASPWWVVAHLCGIFAIAQFACLALRVDDLAGGVSGAVARWASLAGLVLVLPYYGAETFGLHAIGAAAVDGDPATLELADEVRTHPAALTTFGLGLLLLAAGASAVALAWRRWVLTAGSAGGGFAGGEVAARAAWALAGGVVLLLPQFYLPPVGRIAFGATYLLAAGVWAVVILRLSAPFGASART